MFKTAYITTKDVKGRNHNYRVTPEQMAGECWDDETLVSFKEAGLFRLSEIISDQGARNLFIAVA